MKVYTVISIVVYLYSVLVSVSVYLGLSIQILACGGTSTPRYPIGGGQGFGLGGGLERDSRQDY